MKCDNDGRNVRPGPGIISIIAVILITLIILIIIISFKLGVRHYESQRKKAGAHLIF